MNNKWIWLFMGVALGWFGPGLYATVRSKAGGA